MNEGPRKPRAEGQFSPSLKGTEPAKNNRFPKAQMWGFQIMAHSQPQKPLRGQGTLPISNSPSDSHGATSLIRSYAESLLFSHSGMLDSL